MADYFASIFGTEKDKVNCSFYFKIGACRHGDRCSRVHNKPAFSQTILIQNLYVNPQNSAKAEGNGKEITDEENQKHFDEFFEDIYVELEEKYGSIDEMNVCDNLGDHLIGNVYVKFKRGEDAKRAVEDLNNRWFAGKPVYAELSTVTDFREAGCRQYEIGSCTRGGFCNFMHLKQISNNLKRHLFGRSRSSSRSSSSRRSHRHRSGRRSHRSHASNSRSRSRSSSSSRSRHRSSRKSSSRRSRYRSNSRTRSRSLSPPFARSHSRTRSRSPKSPVSSSNRSKSHRSTNHHHHHHHKSSRSSTSRSRRH